VFFGEGSFLWASAFSADGRYLVSSESHSSRHGWHSNSIRVREVVTGQEVLRLQPGGPCRVLTLSPDGSLLAGEVGTNLSHFGGGRAAALILWNLKGGQEVRQLHGHVDAIRALAFSPDGKLLASASADSTLLLWETGGPRPRLRPLEPAAAELDRDWFDLASTEASRGTRAIHRLAAAPEQGIPFLRQKLRPAPAVDAKHLASLIDDLGSDRFEAREKARLGLEAQGELAETALRRVLAGNPGLEVRRRVEGVLDKLDREPPAPEQLRLLRAVTALERAGTKEARQLLELLASGAPQARVTQDAQAALERLARRPRGQSE
jgi:hypothetical protein